MVTFDGVEPWRPGEHVLGLTVPGGEFYDLSEMGVVSATVDFHSRSVDVAATDPGGTTLIRLTIGDIEAVHVADPGYAGHRSVALLLQWPLEVVDANFSNSGDVGDGRGWLSFGVDHIDIAFRARSFTVRTMPLASVDSERISTTVPTQPVVGAVSVLSLLWEAGVPRVVLVAPDSTFGIDSARVLRLPVTHEPVSLVREGAARAVRVRLTAIDGGCEASVEGWEPSSERVPADGECRDGR
ncbi:MAG: hypothetical protein HGA44_08125 [Cellulomonadaceae bacterium]|nr:hypothetical protein [Cellulomonadaceae bacterium]